MRENDNSHDKLIGSLAVLKSDLIESDFISSYIPFVATVLLEASHQEDAVKIDYICKKFEELFGFTIEHAPMITILNKCVKKGLVERRKNAIYSVNAEKCKECCISEQKLEMKKKCYNDVIKKLVSYYESQFSIILSENEAEKYLLAFLNENSSGILIVKFSYSESDMHTPKQHFYIISLFVKECYKNDYSTFMMIQDLATAYLLSSALAYTEFDEKTQSDAFKNLIIYIDTPLLIRILGLNGNELQAAALALLEQMKSLQAKFRIFAHTYDELVLILKDCKRWIEDDKYDTFHASMALRNFVERKFTKADIQEYIDTLEEKIKHYMIQIDDEDYYAGKYYKSQIDDKLIEEGIINIYKANSQEFDPKKKESTIGYDVKSVSAILKLWNRKKARTYRQIKYVLVTTNSTLAYVTRSCLKGENPNRENDIFPCITDVYLGTNIWLGTPVNKIEDFSQKKLLADCMSLIEPSEKLLQTLQTSIEKAFLDSTITEGQYHLLKQKAFTNNYIMNKTLGDETRFTDKIAEELLQEIESEITDPYKKQIETLSQSYAEVAASREGLLAQVDKKKREEEENIRKRKEKDIMLSATAEKKIKRFTDVLFAGLLIPVASFICAISSVLPFSDKINSIILVISATMTLLLGLSVTVLKINLCNIRENLEKWYFKKQKMKEYKKLLDDNLTNESK